VLGGHHLRLGASSAAGHQQGEGKGEASDCTSTGEDQLVGGAAVLCLQRQQAKRSPRMAA
jgi:hypothetical protein